MKKNIFVFPCGSEIALEIYRALKNSIHFNLIGGSSVKDHGSFVYDKYIENIPFITDKCFLSEIKRIVKENNIDAIYPAMDSVIEILKKNEDYIGCKVVSSSSETTEICLSKLKTYKVLKEIVNVPMVFSCAEEVSNFPVFVKPDIGYGSKGAKKINSKDELVLHLRNYSDSVICEFLPGKEYTIDCFTDRDGVLIAALPRERCRVMNGISVNTKPVKGNLHVYMDMANKINNSIRFRGAWFFQVKKNEKSVLTLLEIACRFGGSSGLFRGKGINFPYLSLFDAFDKPVRILQNDYEIEMDRALDNCYKINIVYNEVFIDFDDCILLEGKILNIDIISFIYRCINKNIKITLLTKHDDKTCELETLLISLRIRSVFDRIIQISRDQNKSDFIDNLNSIFIDDSFSEREEIKKKCGIYVFSLDMVGML